MVHPETINLPKVRMRFPWKTTIVLLVLGGAGYASYQPAVNYYQEQNRPKFRTEKAETGDIQYVVNSTGTIQPKLSVQVGSFVSGPIIDLYVDFNDEVTEGQLLAKIDPRIYNASVARDKAALATREADVSRIEARLQNAKNDEKRAMGLLADNQDFISQAEIDQFMFSRMALEAELVVAKAQIKQAEANLSNSQANLDYTDILSPVDGIVIDRKIDEGQTLASQFQTPELFVIAPDMRKEMHVFASVDEADIGLIREAQEAGQKVSFTVDAYPGELFEGKIWQIRLSSTTTQNVVTYPVVVSAANEELKLLPGMTAEITFQIRERKNVVKIPNSALRYFPNRQHVREEDHKILDGVSQTQPENKDNPDTPPADAKAKAERDSRLRHLWIKDGDHLKAVEVVTGVSDYQFTELISGDVESGQEFVVGLKTD